MSNNPMDAGRRAFLGQIAFGAVTLLGGHAAAETQPAITVWKDPDCGCCGKWVDHLRRNGFIATVFDTSDVRSVKARLGVPAELASCHTAEIAGYAIEGHVPAQAILRLLAQKPAGRGLAVPGMPIGSPGMEGGAPQPYDVVLFGNGAPSRFARFIGDRPA
ncbi:MAG TPA: DUF411 domain-containing protein [Hyphomicrobium sp.]|nr:DUF411 domain-containing protein [Hyphomicrobium sp.]